MNYHQKKGDGWNEGKKQYKANQNQQSNFGGHSQSSGGPNPGMSYQPRTNPVQGTQNTGAGQQSQQTQYTQKQKSANHPTESGGGTSSRRGGKDAGGGGKPNTGQGHQEQYSQRGGNQWGSTNQKELQSVLPQEYEPIEKAAKSGQDELLQQLLQRMQMEMKQVNQRQMNYSLHATVDGCNSTSSVDSHVRCMQILLQMGAQINAEKKGKTILMVAVTKGFLELVTEIINQDAWVAHYDSDQRTALHYAIDNTAENLDVVRLLIEQGADFNKETTSDGFTPLILAVKRGHINIVKLLVEQGAKLEPAEITTNNTALHIASGQGELEIIEILVNESNYEQHYMKLNKLNQKMTDVAMEKIMDLQSGNLGVCQAILDMQKLKQPGKKDQSLKELVITRYWAIYDYMNNLEEQLKEKARKAGDTLINEEKMINDQKKTKKQQCKSLGEDKIADDSEVANIDSIYSSQAESQRNKGEKIGQGKQSRKDKKHQVQNDQDQTNSKKDKNQSKNQREDSGSKNNRKQASTEKLPANQTKEKSPNKQSNNSTGKQDQSIQGDTSPSRNNSSPGTTQRGAAQVQQTGYVEGGREPRGNNAEQVIGSNSHRQQTNNGAKNQMKNQHSNQNNEGQNNSTPTVANTDFNQDQASKQIIPSQDQITGGITASGQGQISLPNPPILPQSMPHYMVQQQNNGVQALGQQPNPNNILQNMIGQGQQDYLTNSLVGGVSQSPYAAMNMANNLQNTMQHLDPNGTLQKMGLGQLSNNLNGLGLGQVQQQNDLQSMANQNQQFLGQSQQYPTTLNLNSLQQALQSNQFAQQLSSLGLGANGGPSPPGGVQKFGSQDPRKIQSLRPGQSYANPLGQIVNQNQQQQYQQMNQALLGNGGQMIQARLPGDQNGMNGALSTAQLATNQGMLQQNLNSHGQMHQQQMGALGGLLNPNQQANGGVQPNDLQLGHQNFQQNGGNKLALQSATSVNSHVQLPIRVSLDFSDEKSQNLFIFEQKYNMKKNDCFNLEKQKAALQHQLQQKNEEFETLKQSLLTLQLKHDELKKTNNDVTGHGVIAQRDLMNSAAQEKLLQAQSLNEKTIKDLEESHNEQLSMIEQYRRMSEEKTKFSLEVINKSMLAVDLIKKYKDDGQSSAAQSANGFKQSNYRMNKELEDVEKKIIECQEAIQKDLIPTEPQQQPTSQAKNHLSLKFLKHGSTQALVAAQNGTLALVPGQFAQYLVGTQAYENQASNILEMERRYETSLKQKPIPVPQSVNQVLQADPYGNLNLQANSALGITNNSQVVATQQNSQCLTRHNFYEIQNILHNEILLFKQDANAILREMQQVKEIIIQRLGHIVMSIFPNYRVDVYGSHSTGLCLHWSDIDLVVGPRGSDIEHDAPIGMSEARMKDALRRISESLRSEGSKMWVTSVNYIEQTTVPVIKFECSLSALMESAGLKYPTNPKYGQIYNELFSIDITHMTEVHHGLEVVDLVKEYLLDCWFIEPLILVLKQMLKVNGLNGTYKGGLSSYGLLLMIVAFIQLRKLNRVRIPQNINLGNILLDFLHYYGEILHFQEYGIMCRRPGDVSERENFYHQMPEPYAPIPTCPMIDDPMNPSNNVGKSTFKFNEIQKIFKVGYQSAFLGCFCDCHFQAHKHQEQVQVQPVTESSNTTGSSMSIRSQPFMQGQRSHPVYTPAPGERIPQIVYQDEQSQRHCISIENLYLRERVSPDEKCDSILTKIIYSQAQFKAAEENASII